MNGFLYCYKMTHDTGFAPNPYHDVLTLATCKPTIRRCAKEGYWISGWTSNGVYDKNNEKHEFTDDTQKLIYLAKVTKRIKIGDYWEQYEVKQPKKISTGNQKATKSCKGEKDAMNFTYDMGDNIYEPVNGGFRQHPNGGGHGKNDQEHDLSGENVLICEEFYYFGVENALEIKDKGFVVPRCKKIPSDAEEAKKVIDYVKNNCSKALYYKEK
ncbi:MAG: hypothetical protein IKZ99_12645 [Salinivirgaceae bacterium]|nr:hypothetical protein [Salinivirgaceae bacterium]